MDRRRFMTALAGSALAPVAVPTFARHAVRALTESQLVTRARGIPAPPRGAFDPDADRLASDEDYWAPIQRAFDVDRTLINMNNGGVSPAPSHVMDAMYRDLAYSNEIPVIQMWRDLEPRIELVRRELAAEYGCDGEEMAITRNASESLETLILGVDLARGDEVIVTAHNYGRMLTTWDQRARRDGIVVRTVNFPVPLTSPAPLLDAIAAAITPRTRVIELPHITNLTGQILPIREVCALAARHDIRVFVDGAHAFAHFPFTRDALGADYYGTSLHKWLFAPVGTGFLSVRRERIPEIWPLMAAGAQQTADIRKYEEIGTHPAANHNAIAVALTFHRAIGGARKAARLRFLRDRWARRVEAESFGRASILTPLDGDQACGIGFVHIDGVDLTALTNWFMREHQIVVTPIAHADFQGLRITPSVYTTLEEVDRFSEALRRALRDGVA